MRRHIRFELHRARHSSSKVDQERHLWPTRIGLDINFVVVFKYLEMVILAGRSGIPTVDQHGMGRLYRNMLEFYLTGTSSGPTSLPYRIECANFPVTRVESSF